MPFLDGKVALSKLIAGVRTLVRATVPTDSVGQDFLVAENPGSIEVIHEGEPVAEANAFPAQLIQEGSRVDDDNPLPVNQIIQAEHDWLELCNVRIDDAPTTFATKPYHVDEESGLRVYIFVDSTLAPTHIRVVPEFSSDYDGEMPPGNATWAMFEEGLWASLGWEDLDTASGIWKVYYLPLAGEDWVRFYLVGTGTDANNYFDVRIIVRPFQGAHGVAHA